MSQGDVATKGSQLLDEYLGVSLEVVELLTLLR
jgi:hypothetical protein